MYDPYYQWMSFGYTRRLDGAKLHTQIRKVVINYNFDNSLPVLKVNVIRKQVTNKKLYRRSYIRVLRTYRVIFSLYPNAR